LSIYDFVVPVSIYVPDEHIETNRIFKRVYLGSQKF